MERQLWIINRASEKLQVCITELRKWFTFEPLRPVQLEMDLALKYIKKYTTLNLCEHPERYFKDNPLKKLIIRDAGIGDLLMLEPCLRQLKIDNKITLTVATRYPETLENNPYIDKVIKMDKKEDLKSINFDDYDCWDDLRNYSETCVNREKSHRTDCYNQIFKTNIVDKQPRLYFEKEKKESILRKKKGLRYIGINFDASHQYRRYEKGKEAIEYLLNVDKDNVLVILGHYKFIDIKKNKRIIDFQGKTNIKQVIDIVLDLDYLIAVDSGIMHIGLVTHTPTVGIFSIIHPHLRMNYYKGHYRVIYPEKMSCRGCGSHHMAVCEFGDKKKNPEFLPPCMNINADIMWEKLIEMPLNSDKRMYFKDEKIEIKETKEPIKNVNVNKLSDRKLTLPLIVLNEEHNLPRFIENPKFIYIRI
jgi:ADP-heptose:LPS heptosyltransferase